MPTSRGTCAKSKRRLLTKYGAMCSVCLSGNTSLANSTDLLQHVGVSNLVLRQGYQCSTNDEVNPSIPNHCTDQARLERRTASLAFLWKQRIMSPFLAKDRLRVQLQRPHAMN